VDASANSVTTELSKQDLLSAIDFEINHRESLLSRHGLTIWGTASVTVALAWMVVNEALSSDHDWPKVLLVFVAAGWLIGFFTSPWLKALGWGLPFPAAGRRYTIMQHALRHGLYTESMGYQFMHLGLMLGISAYLLTKGYILVGVAGIISYAFVLFLFGFLWMLMRVRVPIKIPIAKPEPARTIRAALLSRIFVTVWALVPLQALWYTWPIEKSDVRLGLVSAGLVSLVSCLATLIRPPTTTNQLRSVRSRLAFGEMSVPAA
jgi:hypothetical protein